MSPDTVVMGAVNRLNKTVEEFSDKATKQTDEMIRLTRHIKWLTITMLIFIVAQICIAILK